MSDVDSNGSFSVSIGVRNGWCALRLSAVESDIEVRNHWLDENLTSLVEAVDRIASDERGASVYWPREAGLGHFIDFLAIPEGLVHVCVAQAAGESNRGGVGMEYTAERGTLVFSCRVPMARFVAEFVHAFFALRVDSANSHGFMAHWSNCFPDVAYAKLQRAAYLRFKITPMKD